MEKIMNDYINYEVANIKRFVVYCEGVLKIIKKYFDADVVEAQIIPGERKTVLIDTSTDKLHVKVTLNMPLSLNISIFDKNEKVLLMLENNYGHIHGRTSISGYPELIPLDRELFWFGEDWKQNVWQREYNKEGELE